MIPAFEAIADHRETIEAGACRSRGSCAWTMKTDRFAQAIEHLVREKAHGNGYPVVRASHLGNVVSELQDRHRIATVISARFILSTKAPAPARRS